MLKQIYFLKLLNLFLIPLFVYLQNLGTVVEVEQVYLEVKQVYLEVEQVYSEVEKVYSQKYSDGERRTAVDEFEECLNKI